MKRSRQTTPARGERTFPEIESRLRHLVVPLGAPQPGTWRAHHHETGQTFDEYLAAEPVRRSDQLSTIYLCLLGEFVEPYDRLAADIGEYLSLAFDVPVRVRSRVPLSEVPAWARRNNRSTGTKQLLAPFILEKILEPTMPPDALGYLALTTRDLWAGDGWNFVFGQADLGRRVGVISVARHGYPGPSADAYSVCLRRSLLVATHEMGHVLTIQHCTATRCLMNGCNNQDESDRQPLVPCPVCLRKLCWNLQTEPRPYLSRLEAFCRERGLVDAESFGRCLAAWERE